MTDFNRVAFNQDEARKKVLKHQRIVDGRWSTFESFLTKYIRSMSFMYRYSKNTKQYNRLMDSVQKMAKLKWETYPKEKLNEQ